MRRMDNGSKWKSAERLFDAIGMIDDTIIAEAAKTAEHESSRSPSRKAHTFIRRYAVSLTAVLLFISMIGGGVIANVSDRANSDLVDNDLIGDVDGKDEQASQSLDFVLSNATQNGTHSVALDEIDFFDGQVSLIWNYDGENEYHKLTFKSKKAESTLKNCMSKSTQQISATSTETLACSVWISYGNGEVISPYLKESAGNVGYSTLFDYSPEVVPSDSFTDFVREALGER